MLCILSGVYILKLLLLVLIIVSILSCGEVESRLVTCELCTLTDQDNLHTDFLIKDQDSIQVTDIDQKLSCPQTCSENAHCELDGGILKCRCNDLFKGDGLFCEPKSWCDNNSCPEGVTCNNEKKSCECKIGFSYDISSNSCIQTDCKEKCNIGENKYCNPDGFTCDNLPCELYNPDGISKTREDGIFEFCTIVKEKDSENKTDSFYIVVKNNSSSPIKEIFLNGKILEDDYIFDKARKLFIFSKKSSEVSDLFGKYSYLLKTENETAFFPLWIGKDKVFENSKQRYSSFDWNTAFMYQLMTDRFKDGDSKNNFSVADVGDSLKWHGGDFQGIINKIEEDYFLKMGVNVIQISSPILNSHAATKDDNNLFSSSYHSFHPIATGYNFFEDYGYLNPIESIFGTKEKLKELIRKAHEKGIRVFTYFIAHQVHFESNLKVVHSSWFSDYTLCNGSANTTCWNNINLPHFDFDKADPNPLNPSPGAEAIKAITKHALWLIKEFDFDGFRLDSISQMSEKLPEELKKQVRANIVTSAADFFIFGESTGNVSGGINWLDYYLKEGGSLKYLKENMVDGQLNELFLKAIAATVFEKNHNLKEIAEKIIETDTYYTQNGFEGALMINSLGNHDYQRPLSLHVFFLFVQIWNQFLSFLEL